MSSGVPEGYHGSYLEVDLSSGGVRARSLDPALIEDYLGGRGLAARVFYDEVDPGCDPLGPDNVVTIATSPLLGTNAPTSCRGHMVFKSPLTGMIGSSNCGGTWRPVLKSTGYDLVVIKGASREPVLVDITPEKVEIREVAHLWGLDVHQTTDRLLAGAEPGKRPRVLCIGPAGENLVRFATVMNDKNRAYGRGGPGAVFGSKKLKAIRVAGKTKPELADRARYESGRDQANYLIKAVPATKRLLRELGTAGLLKLIDVMDMLPGRNFQDNRHPHEGLDRVCGETLRDTILERAGACTLCPLACQRHTRVGERVGEGPEYETLAMLGLDCGVYSLEAITLANYRCNELGVDTISCGATIACAMELYENGCITPQDADGLDLHFSNEEILEDLVDRIAYRNGLGDALAEGSLRLATRVGRPELSMTVKGMEIPAYDPRASYTQALGYVTSPTGACHLRGGYAVSLAFFGGAKEIPRFSMLQSPIAIRNMQNLGIIQDCLGICRFTGYAFGTEPWSRMVSGVTGRDVSTARLEEVADRVAVLERLFNLEAGAEPEDDTLPERFSREAIQVGGKERVIPRQTIARLRDDYYELQEWDRHGRPTPDLLRRLRVEGKSA